MMNNKDPSRVLEEDECDTSVKKLVERAQFDVGSVRLVPDALSRDFKTRMERVD